MTKSNEGSRFQIAETIEQKPFENPAVQSFFLKWCEANDSIVPRVIDRFEWEEKVGQSGVLAKSEHGKQNLYIPKDLRLWEMVGVMEAVDHDTFAGDPGKQNKKKAEIVALGKTFRNAGRYIAERLDSIKEGGEIAMALLEEFYDYGELLMGDELLPSGKMSDAETEEVDRFLAGDKLYESRLARVANGDREAERRKTLAQFFRVTEKAFELRQKSKEGKLRAGGSGLKPWQNDTPIHSAFLAKMEESMKHEIETPRRELEGSVFRRGMEFLRRNMSFDKLPGTLNVYYLELGNKEKTLREALQIDKRKRELVATRKAGNMVKIIGMENGIANSIQGAIGEYPYHEDVYKPVDILADQTFNCVGASMIGGSLMQEAGLNYLVGDIPEHSLLFMVTSDGEVQVRDMLDKTVNEILKDEMIIGSMSDGTPVDISDIVAFSGQSSSSSLSFELIKSKLSKTGDKGREFVTLFHPEEGQRVQVLLNIGTTLSDLGHNKEAVEAFHQIISLVPNFAEAHTALGHLYTRLGHNDEAIEEYRKAIAINPKDVHSYHDLSLVLARLGHKDFGKRN